MNADKIQFKASDVLVRLKDRAKVRLLDVVQNQIMWAFVGIVAVQLKLVTYSIVPQCC